MSSPLIPFRVALEHLPGLQTGEITRFGAILKDTATGRIVGHVQETGVLQHLLEPALTLNPIAGPASLIGVAQNAQIQSTINAVQASLGTLQVLQIANLASSIAGLGVSAAGAGPSPRAHAGTGAAKHPVQSRGRY